jgi:hypothetical protein
VIFLLGLTLLLNGVATPLALSIYRFPPPPGTKRRGALEGTTGPSVTVDEARAFLWRPGEPLEL